MLPLWIIDITEYTNSTLPPQNADDINSLSAEQVGALDPKVKINDKSLEDQKKDIEDANERQCKFFDLLSQIDHVYISDDIRKFFTECKKNTNSNVDFTDTQSKENNVNSNINEEIIDDNEDKRQARENAIREGMLWYYSRLSNPFKDDAKVVKMFSCLLFKSLIVADC